VFGGQRDKRAGELSIGCGTEDCNLYYICTFSSYRAVNTLRLSNTNQSVNVVQ
jgi:hypothetical protein